MDKVEFLNSTGLGVLVGGLSGAGARRLAGSGLHAGADRRILRITGLTKVFSIHKQ